jgi:thiol:disulfide interchange protein DsbD
MSKKIVLVVFMLFSYLYGGFGLKITQPKFLKPSEAFKVYASKDKDMIHTTISLAKDIHIYDSSLHYQIISPQQLNLEVLKPTPILHDKDKVYEGNITIDIPISDITSKIKGDYTLAISFQGCSSSGMCYQPITKEFSFHNEIKATTLDRFSSLLESGNTTKIADALANESTLFILLVFFVAGLLMALTPCILPMIPILSSIILQQASKDGGEVKKSTAMMISGVYVVSMALMYAIIGVVAGLLDFDLQANMNNPFVIIPVALIFVALAFSLFGYYEIALPASLQAKLNRVSDDASSKGLIGTAVMGAISALLVGACTAPIIGGAILFIVITGKALLGGVALFVMGIGAGVPLLLVGAGASKFVPKPGGWMSMVSKFFGVLMLAMAMAMLYRLVPNDSGDLGYSITRLESEVNATNKPVMVDFYKAGCASCKELEEITFIDPKVQEELKRFKFIHIDVTKYTDDDKAMLKRYNLFGAPNLIFFDTKHRFLKDKSLSGFVKPKDLVKHLKDI